MSKVLCVTVQFLDPVASFHGRADGGEPEWPPSPLRVFQALTDAAASRWRMRQFDDYAKPMLSWLEGLGTPTIIAPTCHAGVPVRIAVPNNDLDVWAGPVSRGLVPKKQQNELKTMKTVRPTHILRGHAVHYLWTVTDSLEIESFTCNLQAAARSITHLGWGVDMVAGNATVISQEEATKFVGERWQPTKDASGTKLRVPKSGTLQALMTKHTAFLERLQPDGFRPVPPLTVFDTVSYRRATDPTARPWVAFRINSVDPDDRPPAFDTTRRCRDVAAWVRHATAKVCDGWPSEYGDIAAFVHGHDPLDNKKPLTGVRADERFMYLPLPSIERRGEKGEHVGAIRRVLIAAPAGFQDRLDWLRRRLPGQELVAEGGELKGMLNELPDSDWVLQRYTDSGRAWSTVTPVIRPGHDDGDATKAEQLLRTVFVQAGLSRELAEAAELDWRYVGFRAGVELVRQYCLPDSMQRLPAYHVRVRFPVAVCGPLAVGAGRYRGFGLFALE
ncbi:MAG: type I-U CRISPR-associated protein Cas5/Cas6 [Planctomycetaceae bacterium]|nr:type I-U CRISPR-associated protein Cas5/Cas6 [Planctomycetaceae bacterium]